MSRKAGGLGSALEARLGVSCWGMCSGRRGRTGSGLIGSGLSMPAKCSSETCIPKSVDGGLGEPGMLLRELLRLNDGGGLLLD